MEAVGINLGYLLIEVGIICLPVLVVGGLVIWYVRRQTNNTKSELIMTLDVSPSGTTIPQELLADATQIEVRKRGKTLILIPVSDAD
ncbi:MAG: hypothetical protein DWQ04_33135 [Chloroflexi bacterium]|nr:MAG: hypothetical protein DWQ04_33135 [Chloroflexota bacterium]